MIFLATLVSVACYTVAIKKQSRAAKYSEIMDMVVRKALQEPTEEELFDASIKGMMNSLDEHSMYFSNKDFEVFDGELKQQFGGVGMYVDINPSNKRLTVTSPIPNSPAYDAGVQAGDIIDEISGKSTVDMTRSDAVELMRGPVNTTVKVTFLRGETQLPKTLERKMIDVPSVRGDTRNADATWNYHLEGHKEIGYIQIIQFGDRTSEEVQDVLSAIDSTTDALIVDLRNNTGGYMTAALDICNMFLDGKYKVIETRSRGGVLEREYFSKSGALYDVRKPVVFLVNRFSASASEIVSACLQDHKRIVVVGERTWGKGTVQDVIPIEKGRSALKLTVASYWRPSGENIDRVVSERKGDENWGVSPNEGFALEISEDQLFQNMRIRNQRAALLMPSNNSNSDEAKDDGDENKNGEGSESSSEDDDPNPSEIPKLGDDPVLKRAIEYLEKVLRSEIAA